jgi:hypothetical protein
LSSLRINTAVATRRHHLRAEARSSDPQRRQPDITRAREKLDWEPGFPGRGLRLTIPNFKQQLGIS